uniref:Macaca fascicularis brain cDNA, clone: QflA-21946 n=1 Tax=Macaca fascicularis TaxID=9541 RepID=I7GMG0_MACFA|nr:unnamed protein product [Macaca fascicularis]
MKIICQQLDNLEEIDKFLETYNLPRPNNEEIENLNRQMISEKIESIIKKTSQRKKPRT